jgi:hypothetical protein
MMDIKNWTDTRLRRELTWQIEWDGKARLENIDPIESECGHPARGDLVCKNCILAEVARRESEAAGTHRH